MSQQPANLPYLVEGYSQSAQIAIDEKIDLMQAGSPPPDVTFLLLGSGNRPDGGFLERFAGLVIPGATGFVQRCRADRRRHSHHRHSQPVRR
jgi:PE-PPE domain